jgi:endonuclease/exonuclease/phosphatase family metal-dependent hydrolase
MQGLSMPHIGEIHLENTFPAPLIQHQTIKVLSWNILRGFQYKGVIETIRSLDPDIICLQEVDWGNERTGNLNIASEIAASCKLNYVFATESEEKKSWIRSIFKNSGQGGGVLGNTLLSKYPITDARVLELVTTNMYHGIIPSRSTLDHITRPSMGKANAIAATISIGGSDIAVYATHFTIFQASMRTRINQLKQLYIDSKNNSHVIIAGDLNTTAHGAFGIYNFLEAPDAFYLKSIFTPEAVYWDKKVLPELELIDPSDKRKDWTLQVAGIYHTKADWILTRGFDRLDTHPGELKYSDHKPLIATLQIA